MSRTKSGIGVGSVLTGAAASVLPVSKTLGTAFFVGGVGWLLRDALDWVTGYRFTERVETAVQRDDDAPDRGDATDENDEMDEMRLMSSEERIFALLRENDGWMKQKQIVAEMPVTDSSVSRNLAKLEDEAQVNRLQIGREKIVYLPGEEPAAAAIEPAQQVSKRAT